MCNLTSGEVAEGAGGVELVVDLHGEQAERPAVEASLGGAHGAEGVVGLARVGGAHVVDQPPLQRARHRVPQVRLAQVQHLDRLAAIIKAAKHQINHAHDKITSAASTKRRREYLAEC